MRNAHAASLALALSLCLTGEALAAAKHKAKDESPPTAKPDATLVVPDPAPPPPVTAPATHPVEAQPIAAAGAAPAAVVPAPAAAKPAPLAVAAPPAVAPPPPPPAPPPEAVQPPVVARAIACLREQAPRASRAETSAKAAVNLLIEDLCAVPVDRAALYSRNLDILSHFTPQSERAAAGLSAARVDPESGEIVNPPAGDVSGAMAAGGFSPGDAAPSPQIRRFAAELVLAIKGQGEAKTDPKTADAKAKPVEPHKGH